MSEFVQEDWKLKARAEVKLRRENTNMLVSHRRLATGNVQCVCSATYQIFLNIFFSGYRSRTRTLTLNPNPNPITDPNPNLTLKLKIKENKTTPE